MVGIVLSALLIGGIIQAAVYVSSLFLEQDPARESAEFWANPTNQLLLNLLIYPFALLVIIGCRLGLDRRSFASLGLHRNGSGRSFGSGALCGALAMAFLFGMLLATGAARVVGPSKEAFESHVLMSLAMWLFYAVLFFCVGFMEELSFRGYALHNLRATLGWGTAVSVQAVVFALVHAGNVAAPGKATGNTGSANPAKSADFWNSVGSTVWDVRWAMLNITLIAIFFALSYRKTGSLWFPIGFHAAWNFCLGCVFSLPVSGIPVFRLLEVVPSDNTNLTGGNFGAEGSMLLSLILAAMLWFQRGIPPHPQAESDMALLSPPYAEEAAEPMPIVPMAVEMEENEDRPRRFKATMRTNGTPELAPAELESLARELAASAKRAETSHAPSEPSSIRPQATPSASPTVYPPIAEPSVTIPTMPSYGSALVTTEPVTSPAVPEISSVHPQPSPPPRASQTEESQTMSAESSAGGQPPSVPDQPIPSPPAPSPPRKAPRW
jgi:membrane protease YdiL (CAAX protease family)